MEAARRDDKLKAGQREEMIRHSFYCFARLYDEETFERLTPLARLLILIAVLTIGSTGYYAWSQTGSTAPPILAAIAIVLIFLSLMFWAFKHSPRKRVRTWLAMALLPLDPTSDELRKARAELQGSRLKAGFQIRTTKLLEKIKKLRAKAASKVSPNS